MSSTIAGTRQGVAGALAAGQLAIPQPGVAVLARPRLTRLIDAALARRLTLVTGPAGAGKTFAIAQWARAAARRPAWLTADPADADPARFWPRAAAALARAGVPEAPPDPAGLAAALAAESPGVVLIIDDAHLLAGTPAAAGLDELIRLAPPGQALLLAGRDDPGLAVSALRLAGDLSEIGAAELACTPEETRGYLELAGLPASDAELAEVTGQTRGWLAGLRLSALARRDHADSAALLRDYIEEQVLAPLPPATRAFLLRTCLTPQVSAGLAQELTGSRRAQATLEQLARAGLAQPGGDQYRYHPMLRQALAACLRRDSPDQLPDLQRRAARWHAARREVPAALALAAQAGDWGLAAAVFSQAGLAVMLSDEGPAAEAILAAATPEDVAAEPVLAVALAAGRLWQGDRDGAVPHLQAAQHADGLAQRWLAALTVLHQAAAGAPAPGRRDAEGPPPEPAGTAAEAAGVAWLAAGFAALGVLDLHAARSALLHAGSRLAAAGLTALAARSRCWEAVAAALSGDLADADALMAAVAGGPHGRDTALTPVLALAGAVAALGRDELDDAAELLDRAGPAARAPRPAGEPSLALLAGLARGRLAIAEGNLPAARGLVSQLTQAAGSPAAPAGASGPGGPAAAVAALAAGISVAAGELDRARAELAGLAGPSAAHAELLVAAQDDEGALAAAGQLLAAPAPSCPRADRIRALLAAAVAHRRLSQPGPAADMLAQALALAEPQDACGPFLAAGPPVRAALTVLTPAPGAVAVFAARILERFDGRLPAPAAGRSAAALSGSELAVLRLLPSHMTNQEIAQALFLSVNTIKTHLGSVYRKLGVPGRRQAVTRGRRLGLLPEEPSGAYRPPPARA